MIGSAFLCAPPIYAADSDTDYVECPHGFSTYNDHVLNGGVGQSGNARRYYWINSNLSSTYAETVRTAMYNWTYTTDRPPYYTTSISFRETSTKSSGTFEFHSGYLPGGYLAGTERLLYQNGIDPMNQNWGWARITLSESVMNTTKDYEQLGTVTHEVGHAMGLAHCPDKFRIMCQLGSGRLVYIPQVYDCQTVNHLY